MGCKISIIDRAKSLAKFLAEGDLKIAEKDLYNQRLEICKTCKYYAPRGYGIWGRCDKCGCSSLKLGVKKSKCVINKW